MVNQSFLEYPKRQGAHSIDFVFKVIIVTNTLLHSFYVLVSFSNLELIGIIATGTLQSINCFRENQKKASPFSKHFTFLCWKIVIVYQFCSKGNLLPPVRKLSQWIYCFYDDDDVNGAPLNAALCTVYHFVGLNSARLSDH